MTKSPSSLVRVKQAKDKVRVQPAEKEANTMLSSEGDNKMANKKIEWATVLSIIEQEIDYHKNGAPKATRPKRADEFIEGLKHIHQLLKDVRDADGDPNCEARRPKSIDFLIVSIPTRLLKVKELPNGRDVIRAINSMGQNKRSASTTKAEGR